MIQVKLSLINYVRLEIGTVLSSFYFLFFIFLPKCQMEPLSHELLVGFLSSLYICFFLPQGVDILGE